jgi:type IV pilus assembly protein PilC
MAPAFIYKACTQRGDRVRGIIMGSDEYQAVSTLRARGYLVTEIKKKGQDFQLPIAGLWSGLSSKELALFCRQLATMLAAGLSLVKGLEILEKQHLSKRMRETVGKIRQELINGWQLSEALRRQPHLFPAALVHMVAAGETGGVLEEVMARMAQHFEKEHNLRERVKGALTYPVVVTLLALGAVVFLITYVLPTFSALFASSGLALPWPTRTLLFFSDFISGNWQWLGGSCILLLLGTLWYMRTEGGSRWRDRFFLALPAVGPVLQGIALSRFCRTLGTLLSGGVPLLPALDVAKNTADNQVINQALGQVQAGIKEGSELATLLKDYPVFPEMMIQMVKVGEETGALPDLLIRIADYYEWEVDSFLKRLSSLLEPALTVAVAGFVGFIVISIMLPLLDLVLVVG